ncbi:MAG: hypothetical protein QMC78_04625 [Methanocellales archaeon]|nr:hypothetical protein [Methanocellales archaeon]
MLLSDNKAQMHTLEAIIAAILMVGAVTFVTMTAPMGIQPAQRYSEVQLKLYGRDALNVLSAEGELQINESDGNLRRLLPENVEYDIIVYDDAGTIALDTNRMPAPNAVVVYNIISTEDGIHEIRVTLWYK